MTLNPRRGKDFCSVTQPAGGGSRTGVGAEILVVISSWSSRHLACLLLHLHSLVTLELSEVEDLRMYQSAEAAITKYHTDWVAYTVESYFLAVWEARSARSRCQQVWFPLRLLSLARRWLSFCCLFSGQGTPGVSLCVLIFSSCKDASKIG